MKKCDYFTSSILKLKPQSEIFNYCHDDYTIMTMLSGSAVLFSDELAFRWQKGDTFFVPAGCEIAISPDNDTGCKIYVNTP